MVSVNTNIGAYIALQNLNATQSPLQTTQERISTGLKVAGPKDNAGVFAIAQTLRAQVGSYQAVSQSLDNASSTVDVALSAAQSVSDLLVQMKQKAVAASDTSISAATATSLDADFQALKSQLASVVSNASFNGKNLLDGSVTTIQAIANDTATSHITVQAQNLSVGGANVTVTGGDDLTSFANASTTLGHITASITAVNGALAKLGSSSKALDLQKTFVSKLSDTLNAGIGNLVDADLAKESANLQALQVKQQLGIQALSIANQSPQILLSLFR